MAQTVRRVLHDEGLVVDVRERTTDGAVWTDTRSAHAVLVDDNVDPEDVREALERGWIHWTTPVFVVAQRLPGRERYLTWLETGAWDVLKIPLESEALALRLRNILEGGTAKERLPGMRRYSLQTLEKVADEALALAHRYHRELYCVALSVDRTRSDEPPHESIVERLAGAAEALVRGSDLIGIGDKHTLLIVLPDTDEEGATSFVSRLLETLEARLREWGIVANLRARKVAASEAESGRDLLSLVVQRLGSTPP